MCVWEGMELGITLSGIYPSSCKVNPMYRRDGVMEKNRVASAKWIVHTDLVDERKAQEQEKNLAIW